VFGSNENAWLLPEPLAVVVHVLLPSVHDVVAVTWTETHSSWFSMSLLCDARSWMTPPVRLTFHVFPPNAVAGPADVNVKPVGVVMLADAIASVLTELFVIVTVALYVDPAGTDVGLIAAV
jgi:hypothetical protein